MTATISNATSKASSKSTSNAMNVRLIAAALLSALAVAPAAAEDLPTHHFKGIASFSSSPVYSTRAKPFWEQVAKDSNGKITADVLTIDQLGLKGGEVFRTIKSGLFNYVTNVMSFAAGDDPRNEALDIAGIAQTVPEVESMDRAYRPVLEKLYETKYNLKLMGVWPIGPVVIWCNAPVTSLADLKGKKVRAFNRTMSDFVQGAGAVPVSMSFGEMVTGLQRGTVDCAITSPRSGLKAGLAEVTTHVLPVSLGWAAVIDAFNVGAWKALDKPTQDFLKAHYDALRQKVYKEVDDETEDAYRCLQGKKPCDSPGPMKQPLVVTPLSAKDKAEVAEIVKTKILPGWAKRCGAECTDEWNKTVGKSLGITLAVK
ncbi:MAG TPA: TRAP transporter substrate-binding protein [Pseudolabrys sp.]|nr:TRAP transporter substrate-binding protein [Pseudolabrys sp.]